MTNAIAVCLISFLVLGIADQGSAKQQPKECTKGPEYWCQSLNKAASCGAVGHCTSTEWMTAVEPVRQNDVSSHIVRLFRQLKDIKDLINDEYLATRMEGACRELRPAAAARACRDNTAHLQTYLLHALVSPVTPESLCRVIGMCNDEKIEHAIATSKKTKDIPKKESKKPVMLGAERCTWGPSYWCSNISTGHECKATHHCVERVWNKMEVPEDTDSICKICTDMVKMARDQLESNETQEELKQVFEGSCALIPIKLVRAECMRLADQFIPDLVETLASQMNPQVVCSVAGLCNNARIDEMLDRYNKELAMRTDCAGCYHTVGVLRRRFDDASYDDFLRYLLQMCRKADSFSDSCSMLVFKYYEDIRAGVAAGARPGPVCRAAGSCVYTQHQHDEFTFPPVLVGHYQARDDIPCEFCEQLVTHFREVMVANTTALEFYKVLKGLCKQTGKFSTECLSLVEQYYPEVYSYLVSDLKPREVCTLVGVCGRRDEPVAPLVAAELAVKVAQRQQLIGADDAKIDLYKTPESTSAPLMPLPIERMFVRGPADPVRSEAACRFCQYLLHYLQVEISDDNTEDNIRRVVERACDHLPQSVEGQCRAFVTQYGPAVIALLVQEIDPASVCPALGVCPRLEAVRRASPAVAGGSNCPLCLFAVEQLETMLRSNTTEANIRIALDHLCTRLSNKLQGECIAFVDRYSDQLIHYLVQNLDAQQICLYLKVCTDQKPDPLGLSTIDAYHARPSTMADRNNHKKPLLPRNMLETGAGDIETNEIPDNTVNGRPVGGQKTLCVMCEFVMTEIDSQIKDKNNEDEIKKLVHGVCHRMPATVRADCDKFVDKYADLIVSALSHYLEPGRVCHALKLCDAAARDQAREAVLDCAVCEAVVTAVKKVLENDRVDRNIVHIVEKSCALLPAKYNDRCHTLLEIYGVSIVQLIETYGSKAVCQKIGLCAAAGRLDVVYSRG